MMRLARSVCHASEFTGSPSLSRHLQALVQWSDEFPLRNVAAFTLTDQVRFAGLGFDEHTEVEIGSITKTFNAELLEQAIDRGEVSAATTVGQLLDGPLSGEIATVSLAELADHESGLPSEGPGAWASALKIAFGRNPDRDVTVDDLLATVSSCRLRNRGERNYSNLGHDLLGHLLARAANRDYADLVQTRIFTPLGMTSSYVTTPGSVHASAPRGLSALGRPAEPLESVGRAPSGSIRSTAQDMARYAEYLLQQRLSKFTWAQIKGTRRYWHNGRTWGFSSMLLVDLDAKQASFVVTDSGADIEHFAFELLGLQDPARSR